MILPKQRPPVTRQPSVPPSPPKQSLWRMPDGRVVPLCVAVYSGQPSRDYSPGRK
jgi:hypothetical protein